MTMSTETFGFKIADFDVQVVRKPIKNLHVGVYPPQGRVRVAAPMTMSRDAIRTAIVCKIGWIKRQRAKFEAQERQSERQYVTGECHYFLGKRLRMHVDRINTTAGVWLLDNATMCLSVGLDATQADREKLVLKWYRNQLRQLIPPMLAKWQPILGVEVSAWGIKKMKTKWGSCNTDSARIWINLELAKKPEQCIEYIVVHELVHLRERNHGAKFNALMDKMLPSWRTRKKMLNEAPLTQENWEY